MSCNFFYSIGIAPVYQNEQADKRVRIAATKEHPMETAQITEVREPSRARALLSNNDFRLLRQALASHARSTEEPEELARISALYHRLGSYA